MNWYQWMIYVLTDVISGLNSAGGSVDTPNILQYSENMIFLSYHGTGDENSSLFIVHIDIKTCFWIATNVVFSQLGCGFSFKLMIIQWRLAIFGDNYFTHTWWLYSEKHIFFIISEQNRAKKNNNLFLAKKNLRKCITKTQNGQ